MDAIIYLKQQHSQFRKTLNLISKITNKNIKQKKFTAFAAELTRHETVEEKVFYPVLRKNKELRDIIKHLIAEEKSAAKAIKSLKKTEFDLIWRLKFIKFKRDVDHHAKEEEKELFPKVRKFLNKAELDKLGTQMKKYKSALK